MQQPEANHFIPFYNSIYKIAIFVENEKQPRRTKTIAAQPFSLYLCVTPESDSHNQKGRISMHRFIVVFVVIMIVVGVASAQGTKSPTVSLAVSGMKCENCVAKVDKALRGVEGVKDVKVDLKNQTAQIVLASASVKSDLLIKAVKDAGFQAKVGKGSATTKKADCCTSGSGCKKEGAAAKKDGDCCKDSKKVETKN